MGPISQAVEKEKIRSGLENECPPDTVEQFCHAGVKKEGRFFLPSRSDVSTACRQIATYTIEPDLTLSRHLHLKPGCRPTANWRRRGGDRFWGIVSDCENRSNHLCYRRNWLVFG